MGPISRDLVKRKGTVLRRVPLTDKTFSIKTLNAIANSAQCREKGLKILQYVLRGLSYLDVTPWSKELKGFIEEHQYSAALLQILPVGQALRGRE